MKFVGLFSMLGGVFAFLAFCTTMGIRLAIKLTT